MGATVGTLNKKYVSAVNFLDQRDINPNIIDVANDSGFTKTMKMFGRTKQSKMYNFRHFVNSDMFVVAVAGTVTGSGTATVTVALTAGSGFFRKLDNVKFPNDLIGVITGISTAAGVDTLTIKSDNGNLTLVTGNSLTYAGNSVGEASTAVDSRVYDVSSFFNLIQIFRESDSVTDVQKASKVEVQYKGQFYYSLLQFAKKAQAFSTSIDLAMIGGRQSSTQFSDANPAMVDGNGNAIQRTMGLDQYVDTYGVKDSVATTGQVKLTDMDDLSDQLNAAKAPNDFMGYLGDSVHRAFDTLLKNLGSSDVTSGRMKVDGKETDFTTDGFKYGKRSYEFINIPLFDHPNLLNATIKGSVYWIPKGQVTVDGGGTQPRIQIRFMPHGINGGNELIGEWHTGALAPTPNGDKADFETHWISHQGLEVLGAQQFARQKVIF